MTEAQLVAAAKSGENAALDALFRSHTERLFRTVWRITRNHHDAEDVVQDSLVGVFLHIDKFDGRSSFSTWLTRIGINSALMTLRKKRKYRGMSIENDDGRVFDKSDSTQNPERQLLEQERAKLVREAVAKLRPSIRLPVELKVLQENSLEEMAARMGISASVAKARLHHARAALRKSKTLSGINNRPGRA